MKKILNLFMMALVCCMMVSCTTSKVNEGIEAAAAGDFAKAKTILSELYAGKDKLSSDQALGACAIINVLINTDQSLAQDNIAYVNQFLELYTLAAKDPKAVEKFNTESGVDFTGLFNAYSTQLQAIQAAQDEAADIEDEEEYEEEGEEEYVEEEE